MRSCLYIDQMNDKLDDHELSTVELTHKCGPREVIMCPD